MIPSDLSPLSPLEERLLRYLRTAENAGVVEDEDLADLVPTELYDQEFGPYDVLFLSLAKLEARGLIRKVECYQFVRMPEATP